MHTPQPVDPIEIMSPTAWRREIKNINGVDPVKRPTYVEDYICKAAGIEHTPRKKKWDGIYTEESASFKIEVKYSRGYSPLEYIESRTQRTWRWDVSGKPSARIFILVGYNKIDDKDDFKIILIPSWAINQKTVTYTHPSLRKRKLKWMKKSWQITSIKELARDLQRCTYLAEMTYRKHKEELENLYSGPITTMTDRK